MGYFYQTEQWLPYPIEAVFAFFADPHNLPALLPEWRKARLEEVRTVTPPRSALPSVLTSASPATAGVGTRLTLSFRRFRYLPVRVHWEAEIDEFSWNNHFCDRQVRGPFARWNHCHRLRAFDREGIDITLVLDRVEYALPFGVLGKLAHFLFVRRQIKRTFDFRQSQVADMLAQGRPRTVQSQHIQPQSKSA